MDETRPGADGTGVPPAGWFPDPGDPTSRRYWDGRAWTEQRAPGFTPPMPVAPGEPASTKRWWVVVLIVVLVLLLLLVVALAVAAGSDSDDDPAAGVTTTTLGGVVPVTTVPGVSAVTTVAGASAVTTVAGAPAATTVAGAPATNAPPAPVALASCVAVSELSPMSGSAGEVALYQQTLKNLGFDPGEVDGRFGPNTFSAGLAEVTANGTGGFGVDVFPDDSAILGATLVRLGIACGGQAPAAPAPTPTSPPATPAPTSPPAPPAPTLTPFTTFNDPVSIRVSPDEDAYFVDVVAGDRLEVFLEADPSSGIDPFITLMDPSGADIASDDDSAGGLDAKIDIVVSQAGTFTVWYTSLSGAGPGQITVFING